MRTPSGILHVVDFKTDQIISAIQPQDYWDDKRHWELKNNVDMLDFTTFDGTPHSATLQQQNLVLKEVRDGRVIPYVITEAEKDSDKRSITAYASGAWIQIAKSGIINPQRIESKTVNEFIDMALLGMKWKRGITEYGGFHTMTIDEFIDPLTFLKKTASLFDLEIQYRVEVVGSQITGWYVDMVQKRGRETGKEVELGKDLVSVKRMEHSRDICTALVGFVRGEEEKVITVESINNGLPYITDSDAFQRWNERGQHKFGFYTPETEEAITPQRLMTLMKTELKKRVNTSVSYEVQAQSIGRVFGLAHELINEGDTIKIKDTGFTPKLYVEARVIAGDESFTDPTQDKYVFGDYREIVDPNEEVRKIYNRILASLGDKQAMLDQLEKAVNESKQSVKESKKESEAAKILAEKVQQNLNNYQTEIIKAKNAPTTGLEVNKTLWLDTSKTPYLLYLWNGTEWRKMGIDTPEEIGAVPKVEFEKSTESIKQSVGKVERTQTAQGEQLQQAKAGWENTAKALEGKVEIKQVEDYVAKFQIPELKDNVKRNQEKLLEQLAEKVATEQYNQKITDLQRMIQANAEGIEIRAFKKEVYTRKEADGNFATNAYVKEMGSKLQVLDEGILAEVKNGNVIAAINMSSEEITIDVAKLKINADTIVKWLTAEGIDTNFISVRGDKIKIDKNGVTVKMLDFLFEDERGLRTTVLSKRNLVIDHDFSSTPKRVIVGNTSYSQFEMGKMWRPNGNVVIENNTLHFDYERMVNATRIDMFNYPETTVKNGIHPGNIYTVSAHFRCATINGKRVTARPQLHVCYVTYRDNVHYDIWYESKLSFDAPSTFYGDIQRRAFTFTVPNNYKPGEHAIVIKVGSADGDISKGTAVCASGVQLVTGKYPSMYEWQAQNAEVYNGIMPIDSLEFGHDHGFINVAQDRQTFDIGGKVDVKFHNYIRAAQGINLGGNANQQWGHIRFTDGNRGIGFYVNNSNGWHFNALG